MKLTDRQTGDLSVRQTEFLFKKLDLHQHPSQFHLLEMRRKSSTESSKKVFPGASQQDHLLVYF